MEEEKNVENEENNKEEKKEKKEEDKKEEDKKEKKINEDEDEENYDELKINKKDPLHWKTAVSGPENSPYEKGKFKFSINFEENKENKSDKKPKIKFLTKIYHYNIKPNDGELLCPFIWNSNLSEEENLKNIKLLLNAPDSRYPCTKFIQEEYYNNYPKYKEKALKFS